MNTVTNRIGFCPITVCCVAVYICLCPLEFFDKSEVQIRNYYSVTHDCSNTK